MMKELGNITPKNFGIMYCLDVLWKLILVRFELLLESEDELREKLYAKTEAQIKKKYEAATF